MRHHARAGAPARRAAGLGPIALVVALVLLAACGQGSTTAGTAQPTPTDTATPTFAPTATATATAAPTQTPAHMFLRVTPDPGRCATPCDPPSICTAPGGATCGESIACGTATSFPYFEVDNSGQTPLTWSWAIVPSGTPTSGNATLTLTPNGGTVAGGSAVTVTLSADKNLLAVGPKAFTITFSGGGASIAVPVQC